MPLRLRRMWLVIGWLLVALVVYLSLTPRPLDIPVEEGDKLGHLLAYGTLMLWFAYLYCGTGRWRAALGFAALGVVLEFLQEATGYRTFDVWDMVADAAGVLCGLALAPPRMPHLLYRVETVLLRR